MASPPFLIWSCISRDQVVALPQPCVCSALGATQEPPFPSFWAMELLLLRKEERLGTFPPDSKTPYILCLLMAYF